MVKFWDEARKIALANVKENIKRGEKHGIGMYTMSEKQRLKRLERIIELSKQ